MNGFDVAGVAGLMLWPHDEQLRKKAVEAAAIDVALVAGMMPAPADPSKRPGYYEALDRRPRVSDYEAQFRQSVTRGAIAGSILQLAVDRDAATPGMMKLGAVKSELGELFGVSRSTIDNDIWPVYRSVAHLWAAWNTYVDEIKDAPPARFYFPCPADRLPDLFACARAYGERASAIVPHRSPHGPLIPAADLVELPEVA